MFDLNRTIKLVTGALFDSEATWQAYLPESGDWKKTAFLLTGPLIVASAVIAYLLSLVAAGGGMFGYFRPSLLSTLVGIITSAIGAGVVAFIFSALAGVFDGKRSFAHGLAATTLALVPGYVGQALMWLPWIGGLLALGLAIYSLVLLWKIIPLYLEVPDPKRALHYIVSLVATIVVMVIIGRIINPIMYGPEANSPFGSMMRMDTPSGAAPSGESTGGMFGDIGRKAAIIAEAEQDTYSPPADGKVTERQMRDYVAVMQLVAEDRAERVKRIEALAEKTDSDGEMSVKDFGNVMSGMSEIGGMSTVEIEAVRAAGGNWAEHKWVRDSLWAAARQRTGSDAIDHNYDLYQKYASQLSNEANE